MDRSLSWVFVLDGRRKGAQSTRPLKASRTTHTLLTPPPPPLTQERADDEHSSKGQRLVQEEQEALLRGGALGDGINLSGVSASRDAAAVAAATADRHEAAAAIQLTKSGSRSRNMDEESGRSYPSPGVPAKRRENAALPGNSLSRIDDLFGNLGGRQGRADTTESDEGSGGQRLLPANGTSSSSFSWNMR